MNFITSGAVYVFMTSDGGDTWSEQQKLVASDSVGGDHFGFSLSLDGGVLLAGAVAGDTWTADTGMIRIRLIALSF